MSAILVIDDSQFMRDRCDELLSPQGYDIYHASDGLEGVESYKKLKPTLVLMDMTMPEMDGLSAVREIMKFDPHAKIVMVSAVGQLPVIKKCMESGAKYFLVKPFDSAKLIEAVKRYCK